MRERRTAAPGAPANGIGVGMHAIVRLKTTRLGLVSSAIFSANELPSPRCSVSISISLLHVFLFVISAVGISSAVRVFALRELRRVTLE